MVHVVALVPLAFSNAPTPELANVTVAALPVPGIAGFPLLSFSATVIFERGVVSVTFTSVGSATMVDFASLGKPEPKVIVALPEAPPTRSVPTVAVTTSLPEAELVAVVEHELLPWLIVQLPLKLVPTPVSDDASRAKTTDKVVSARTSSPWLSRSVTVTVELLPTSKLVGLATIVDCVQSIATS